MASSSDALIDGIEARELRSEQTGRRINRALKTLSAGNRTLLRASDEGELLRDMCRVIVEEGGYRMAWVGYAQQEERKTIRPMASAGLEDGYLDLFAMSWADTESGRSAAGTAIRTGRPSVGRNILSDPSYAGGRAESLKRGYAGASAFPLVIDGNVIGNLSILASEPDAFDAEEVQLLGELAEDLAYGIAHLRIRIKHQEAQATIARMANYDALSGLPNRSLLRERLEAAIEAARRQHRPLAVLLLSVGRFPEINDTLGYRQGDQLLREISRRIVRGVQEDEMVARVGEAQFGILLPGRGAEYASQAAERLIGALNEPVEVCGLMVDARASIGIALFPGHGSGPDALIRRAQVAAFQAERTAAGYAVYQGGLDQEASRRLALMGELRTAIEQNELLLYCQPKVHIPSRAVCGAEALVRWQHRQQGMIPTGEFIKLAEHAGLISPLTHWVLEAAFSHAYRWHEAGLEQPLSVNLSAQDLRDPKLIDCIKGLFATWGTPAELIQFELTESALMEDPAGALEMLTRLKKHGVKLLIDDYGTGYSSLSYLHKLPVDAIKIDQSFVAPMTTDEDSAVIVRSTIELGHNLGLEVVAEGVESEATWERLAAMGCDVAQGYFVAMPMPGDRFQDWGVHSRWSLHGPRSR